MNALNRLMVLVQKLDAPWLVCADFNTPASSWLNERPIVVCPEPAQPTYPANGQPVEPVDYCVASPDLHVETKVLPVGGSGHLPLLVFARLASEAGRRC
jgi:endonuclease/exonuclease/phosphatase family metal-dependent hydrolase